MARSLKAAMTLLVFFTSGAFASDTKAVPISKYQDWETRMIVAESRVYFRALTFNDKNALITTLSIDRIAPACKPLSFVIRVLAKTRNKADIDKNVFGQMRVDEREIRNVLFNLSGQKDDQYASLTLINWDREGSLTHELAAGNTLRIKLSEDGDDTYFNFSLQGFEKSFVETRELCELRRQLPKQEKDDADYFKRGV